MSADSSMLAVNNKRIELGVKDGTVGPSVLDISTRIPQMDRRASCSARRIWSPHQHLTPQDSAQSQWVQRVKAK
jgi:hypothetical protein